ncbi:MAG: hypothetical protein KC493_11755 [Bacteriovoracaceae bacterium]|nr:hypothetical protein [Bacteriovoracaceae bacterium]
MLKKSVSFILLALLLSSCGEKTKSPEARDIAEYKPKIESFEFNFPKPSDDDLQDKKILWATYYNLPVVAPVVDGFPLRDMRGISLGPILSRKDWCASAMEGSVVVIGKGGSQTTYNYAGTSEEHQVDCSPFYNHAPSHKVKFGKARGRFGDGVQNYLLVPFRSIAVDRTYYPYGSVFYIPEARGAKIPLPNGKTAIHDGYFFAADTGGLIKKNHIDVYIGTEVKSPFKFIHSNPSKTFEAYVVHDQNVEDYLINIHLNHSSDDTDFSSSDDTEVNSLEE